MIATVAGTHERDYRDRDRERGLHDLAEHHFLHEGKIQSHADE